MKPSAEYYMGCALELAKKGGARVSPNPMVGAVIVSDDSGEIIGRGYHRCYGEPHAEVNAVADLKCSSEANYRERLANSTMYVTLEPCSHYGKTPPCADMIIEMGVPRVVVGCLDPHEKVSGRGVAKLREAGVDVVVGVLESECRELNRRFITAHSEARPYVILKWAQSSDGFLDIERTAQQKPAWFTGLDGRRLVHSWRALEDAIMVGRVTAEMDNPALSVREVEGRNPVRVVLDRGSILDDSLRLFDGEAQTIVYTASSAREYPNAQSVVVDFRVDVIPQILADLHSRGVLSLIVEGGATLLNSFIDASLWDEARVFVSKHPISYYYDQETAKKGGVEAPEVEAMLDKMEIKMGYRPHLVEPLQLEQSGAELQIFLARQW